MKSNNILFLFLVLAVVTGCGGGGSDGGSGSPSGDGGGSTPTGTNVLSLTVNGSLCSSNSYLNKPCVSVTVCAPGTSTCQTINDILLDTGDTGLRLFKQVLTVSLTEETDGSGSIAECIQYADGSSNWGPVEMASIILGSESVVQMPIQVIDATFSTAPTACQNANKTPADTGFNGSMGVGVFAQDCGPACANSANNGIYYSCGGSSCSGTAVTLANQIQNPVALLPQDNNGVIVQLPSVPAGGSTSVTGNLVLGIGTQSNNVPSGVKTYDIDPVGNFVTKFNGITYNSSFIDSGSNGLFFTAPSASTLPDCPSPDSGWFCPTSTTSLSATNIGASGSPSGVVSFQIGNFITLLNSPNYVFADIGGSLPGGFDWGLPFYFGRKVYVGIEGKQSTLGTGPYWAY